MRPKCVGTLQMGPHHWGDAAVSDADADLGLLGARLGVCYADDVRVIGGLDVAHGPRDGHVDLSIHVGGATGGGSGGSIGQCKCVYTAKHPSQ